MSPPRLSKAMRPIRCALLESVTTRASSRPSISPISRPVSAKWPRWLVPNWSSKPSAVLRRGVAITPALLISRSRPWWPARKRSANSRTESRLARSSSSSSSLRARHLCLGTRRSALSPFSRFAAGEHHARALPRELARGHEPEPAVGAGDDGGAAGSGPGSVPLSTSRSSTPPPPGGTTVLRGTGRLPQSAR